MKRDRIGGYAGKDIRVDMTTGRISIESSRLQLYEKYLGGRGVDAKILFDEMKPGTDPLGPENILCFSTGPLTGLLGPTTGRVNVAAISPLTGIYGNSNAGTNWGPELKYAGYDRIIVTGRAESPRYLFIEDDRIELRDASHLWGKGVFDTILMLKKECDDEEIKVAVAGPAAEKGVLFGSVIFDYWDAAGRTGMGTVMASKNLKAIAVRGTGGLKVADPKRYMEVARNAWNALLADPGFKAAEHSALGTAICVSWGNAQGWLPTRNFQEAQFEHADAISGEEFRDRLSTKLSPIPGGRACMSCPNRCKRFGMIRSGKYAGTRGNIEFEGIAAFGSKCGVSDLDAVFHAYMLANDYGMDCISCGNMIATFMELNERGLLPKKLTEGLDLRFGNADAMVECVHRIGNMQGKLGALGAKGAHLATKTLCAEAARYATSIKGMDTIACDPRASKGFGFSYAVASRGSDHLRAHAVYEMLNMPPEISEELFGSPEGSDRLKYGGKVRMIAWHEELAAITDSIGSCRFIHASYYPQYPIPELMFKHGKTRTQRPSLKYHEWISAATGFDIDYDKMLKIGKRIINLERAINLRLGIRRKDDTLPQRFFEDPIPSGPARGEVFDRKQFEKMLDEYYDLRGWDKSEGLMLRSTLEALEMNDVIEVLEREWVLL